MQSLPSPKKAAALIRSAFSERSAHIKTRDAYNLLAQLWGHKDWATYRGKHPQHADEVEAAAPAFEHTLDEVKDWPTWVVCNRMADDGGEDEIWVLPYGATIENRLGSRWSSELLKDDDAIPLTLGFTDPADGDTPLQGLVVVTHVASEYPSTDEYGMPVFANHREVADWVEEVMGWGYLADAEGRSLVDVTGRDRGDDGCETWWAEIRVHPSVHQRVLKQFETLNVDFDAVWPYVVFDDPYVSRSDPKWDPRVAFLRGRLGFAFSNLGGITLGALRHALTQAPDNAELSEDLLRRHTNRNDIILHLDAEGWDVRRLLDFLDESIGVAAERTHFAG